MRRSILLTSLLVHTLVVGGAIWFAREATAANTEPASLFWQPSEPTPLTVPPPPSEATRVEREPDPATELRDPEIVEELEPFEDLPERVTFEPPPPEESWLAKVRPETAVRVVPPPKAPAESETEVADAVAEPEPSVPPTAYVEASPLTDRNPPPDYPRRARELGQEGEVWVAASVDERGDVQGVALLRACRHPLLNREAMRAVRGWRFTPARRDGVTVAAVVEVPVYFRLQEGR